MIKAFTIGLIMGAVIGTAFGMLIMACVQAGNDDDNMANKISHAKDPDRVNKMKAMSEVKLKPCPFCGSITAPTIMDQNEAMWIVPDYDGDLEIVVCCASRKGGCGASTGLCDTSERAVEVWNTRYTDYPSEINENVPNSGENNLGE